MVFQPARTFAQPGQGQGPARGFPHPGAGRQTTGQPSPWPGDTTPREAVRPTKGRRTWFGAAWEGQRGYGAPEDDSQRRPAGTWGNDVPAHGGAIMVWTPYYDRGAAAYVPNFGKVLTNPIGAGIVALQRPQASYGESAQYLNGAIWWTSQAIPTSVYLDPLTSPDVLAALLGQVQVQAVVRTTG